MHGKTTVFVSKTHLKHTRKVYLCSLGLYQLLFVSPIQVKFGKAVILHSGCQNMPGCVYPQSSGKFSQPLSFQCSFILTSIHIHSNAHCWVRK